MALPSSGKPLFHDRKHDSSLSVAICNGLRPEFWKGTPEIYKKLAYRYKIQIKDQYKTLDFWFHSINNKEVIKIIFEEAGKEIPNISTSHEKDHDSFYIS
ncbi:hypothetical protein C1646_763533 [Rhizophagus diaphanus]|nr:hypothetical protein C1646_763533 [Rhizophagus diaphanus] [Rhizophagus sp. MUCL 43196]